MLCLLQLISLSSHVSLKNLILKFCTFLILVFILNSLFVLSVVVAAYFKTVSFCYTVFLGLKNITSFNAMNCTYL